MPNKKKGKNTDDIWESIVLNQGSVQHLSFLNENEKEVFKTFTEISPLATMSKKYNFVYKTVNLLNSKYYIGVHSTNNLDDGYIGCGVTSQSYAKSSKEYGLKSAFINAVVKYGYGNFKREILSFTKTIEEALEIEELIVDRNFVDNPNTYNTAIGGKQGKKYTTTFEVDECIFQDYMNGMSKKEISNKYNIGLTLIWRIIKNKDKSLKIINTNYNKNKRNNIEKWVSENGEEYLRKYINWEITWVQLNKILPFDLRFFNLIKNVKRNKKYVCIHNGEDIFFDTENEISDILGVRLFRTGFIKVIEGKTTHYKNYKFRKSNLRDFKEPNYDEIIRKFIIDMSESLKNLKFNTNRGVIKN